VKIFNDTILHIINVIKDLNSISKHQARSRWW